MFREPLRESDGAWSRMPPAPRWSRIDLKFEGGRNLLPPTVLNLLNRLATLCFIALLGASPILADSPIRGTQLEKIVAEVSARQKKIETLRADFKQEKTLSLLARPEVSSGRLVFEKPNRVLWTYETPKPVTMLIDDGWMTTYYPELHRAEKLQVKRFEDRIFRYLGASAAALEDLGRYFDFRFIDDRTKSTWVLELDPKSRTVARRVRKLTIWIDRTSYLTTKFEYVEGDGDVTRYEFSNIETNVALAPNQFQLELPPGVRVEQVRLNR